MGQTAGLATGHSLSDSFIYPSTGDKIHPALYAKLKRNYTQQRPSLILPVTLHTLNPAVY